MVNLEGSKVLLVKTRIALCLRFWGKSLREELFMLMVLYNYTYEHKLCLNTLRGGPYLGFIRLASGPGTCT